uniref:ThyX n=1 Tax=Geladintestivirus 4 TaxID=3233136 RepID=A0AAU8MK57_9CAUD
MIKVINPNVEQWCQDDYTLDAIWKHIARCARVCYQSRKKADNESEYDFLVRTLFRGNDLLNQPYDDVDLTTMHLSVLEHGTVHLKISNFDEDAITLFNAALRGNKYSRWKANNSYIYVTTNMRVIIENNLVYMLKYIDITPNNPYYPVRCTFSFTTDIGVSRELNRHRVHSISEESTRYCRYTANKFGRNITVVKLPWIDYYNNGSTQNYENGFFTYNEILCDDELQSHFTKGWTAIDWYLYGLQIANLVYSKCVELGWTAQQAREILPLNTKTQVVHTAFASDWEHWIKLRCNETSGKVHPCMREVAQKLKELMCNK